MLPFLDGVRLKLQRAYRQIDALTEEMAAFLKGDPYQPKIEFRRIRGTRETPCIIDFTVRMVVNEQCPGMWSIIIGEIVHDLRSALDHLVYQLVIFATDKPPANRDRTQFPIFLESDKFQTTGLGMLVGVSKKATALIKSLQPFATGEHDSSPLWHLNQLSNIDKHRTLHLTGGTMQAFNFSFPPVVNPGRIDRQISERGAFGNNTIIARGRMYSELPMFGNQVEVKAEISFDIVFAQGSAPLGEWSVIRTLLDAADRSRECVAKVSKEVLCKEFTL
jgi:hypothetical protein